MNTSNLKIWIISPSYLIMEYLISIIKKRFNNMLLKESSDLYINKDDIEQNSDFIFIIDEGFLSLIR